ncbi:hypothetical protein [Marinimicrobium sp. ABcell2]|uniref:hypothetical protein n=1 Tax=Marinimicrobium sp. ABcell2 TaxID=3069751 RepID=UPI0027B37E7B|nr:hypothetical protein [Marinimicrobium sp. ABcell2]MDQ2077142.1 hypothetical protein [Marinimicrobium sp. ABcell2]
MLQKLLIAFLTVFLLSACGGSSNGSGPDVQNPPPADTDDSSDDTDDSSDDTDDPSDDIDDANDGADDNPVDADDSNGGGDDNTDDDNTDDDNTDDADGTNSDDRNTLVFNMGDSRWNNDGRESTLEYRDDEDVLVIIPDFTRVECPQSWDSNARCMYVANHTVDGPLDLRGSQFVFELEISQSILDNGGDPGGIVLVAYVQESTAPWEGAWTCATNNQNIESTTFTYECTMPEDNDALNLAGGGDVGKVGLQILRGDIENSAGGVNNDIEGTITMKSFVIHYTNAPDDNDDANDDDTGGDDTGNDDTSGDDTNDDDGGTNDDDSNTLVFSMGDSRWNNDGFESTLEYRDDDDVLVIIPDFTRVECPQSWDADARCLYIANHTVDGPLDLRGSHFVFELEISQSILDNGGDPGGIVLQAYVQESTDPWHGAWTCATNNQDIGSTTFTYECTMPEDNDALNLTGGDDAGKVGLQVLRGDIENSAGGVNNDIEGTVTMKSFVIHLAAD